MMGRREGPASTRRLRDIKAAVLVVLVLLVFSFFYRRTSKHSRSIHVLSPSSTNPCASSELLTALESQIFSLTTANDHLENNLSRLVSYIEDADRRRDEAEKRVASMEAAHHRPQKAGPYGTVKAPRVQAIVADPEPRNRELASLLRRVAIGNEVAVTLANSNVKEMLRLWDGGARRAGVRNRVVVALDEGVEALCRAEGVAAYRPRGDGVVEGVGRTGSNHAVSGLKFRVLRELLEMGYAVLVSDADVVFLRNPFDHLYRDSDVEAMSDGHDNQTAYGYFEDLDDAVHIWVHNSGFFYIRPTMASIELLDRVAARLQNEPNAWDQAVFNEELFFPSHPGYSGLHASRRTMDLYDFMNSKVLFKHVRHDPRLLSDVKPVVVHINSHPEKMERMRAVVEFYVEGKKDALEPFADGSGMRNIDRSS